MNCPRDHAKLERTYLRQAPVEKCPLCAGMFLKHGELNRVADSIPGDLEYTTVDDDTFQHDDEHATTACPHDGLAMLKADFNVDTTIILDYCTGCRGFWLDGGELQRINEEVKRLNEAGAEIPDPLLIRLSRFFWSLPVPH
jgi:Zn-finger nucleic acid-binding protein